MYLLDNYDFLESLVIKGQAIQEPFFKDGFCLADKIENPNSVYVFVFKDGYIWAKYGWTKVKNRAFLKFHLQVENLIFSFGMPILRMGKNQDYKNHTTYVGKLDNIPIYQFKRSNIMGGGGGSSKSYTYNTIDVKPVTNVEIDTEDIANALKDMSDKNVDIEKVKVALTKAGLDQKVREQELEEVSIMQKMKVQHQVTLVALILGGAYIYKHLKKGKQVK